MGDLMQGGENGAPEWLPEFPTDDAMLDRIDHALGTCWEYNDDGERVHHGGDYTLNELLDFMSGYDPSLAIPLGTAPGLFGDDVEWSEYPFPTYHEHDVIRALVSEVRRLRTRILPPTNPAAEPRQRQWGGDEGGEG